MNEKDIYELIGSSFDDKIKLDFDDVKKRIAALPKNNITPIAPAVPSDAKRKKNVYTAVAAAAACLVCVIALSVVLSQPKYDSASMESESYFNASEEATAYDSAACYSPEAEYEESFNEPMFSDEALICDDAGDLKTYSDSEYNAFGTVSSPSDCISDSDISASDAH